MRFSRLFCACLACSWLGAAELEFVRVWPGWRNAESFDRISEYFGGGENFGRQTILRSQAEARAGYYFLVRVKSAAPVGGASFEVHVISPDNPEPKKFTFPATIPAKETVFQLGLTGDDWAGGENAKPVAWKIVLLTADGKMAAEHKSFLWEKPAQ